MSSSLARKRWRTFYMVFSCSRFWLSVAKELVARKNNPLSGIFQSQSYTILDIEPSTSQHEDGIVAPLSCNPHVDQTRLTEMVKEKKLDILCEFGGAEGVAAALGTNLENGIHGDDGELARRRDIFGSNTYRSLPPKGFFYFVYDAFKDTTILILLVCAALSLGFGIQEDGAAEGWYEGGSIFVAVFLVVAVSAFSNFRQEKQFDKLSKISNNIQIDVVRDGRRSQVSIFDLVVGDVVFLKIGDQIPTDGLFLSGHSLQVDESSMTGESDHVEVDPARNPFLLSGSKVVDGYAQMLVTSVGMNTAWGEMMSSITRDTEEKTPLQARLDKLTSSIGKVGLLVAFLVLVVMLIRYFMGKTTDENGNREYNGSSTSINDVLSSVVHIVAAAVTIVVVAIPEGLPLAVTLTLAYSMKRMMADQAMVRKLSACETMGSATVICTDKTGTLTLNQMRVTTFWLGQEAIEEYSPKAISPNIIELLHHGVGMNTTGSVSRPIAGSVPESSGSPTEKAILSWAVLDLHMDAEEVKQSCSLLHIETFNSEKKRSGVLVRKKADNTIHVHWKGAAEMVLAMCSNYYDKSGITRAMNKEVKAEIEKIIQGMAASSLRCIAFAHKQMQEQEIEPKYDDDANARPKLKEDGFTLLGIVGLKDPCRPRVKKAVEACQDAGVDIKMITGDNIFTAKAIATECGILQTKEISIDEVVEGAVFRNYTHEERMDKVNKIRVMARSSPLDKLLMVQCLKQKGHVVAVTGDGTNDAPALKEADIGLSMGIQGTEVAKESSDIVILDDNFSSVVTVLKWGRCVYNNIQKFIQFQLTVNVAALVINFIAAVSAGEVPLTAVQLLWVNLIMDTLGALALATERPTDELMKKPPVGRKAPLITNIMWRNLLAQALYQIAILLTLQFKGKSIFNVDERVKDTLIFNTFVLCQVFNEFNSRKLEKRNVFTGLHKNKLFIAIVAITIVLQVVMVEFLKKFADTERLNLVQWMACIVIAAFSWPIGCTLFTEGKKGSWLQMVVANSQQEKLLYCEEADIPPGTGHAMVSKPAKVVGKEQAYGMGSRKYIKQSSKRTLVHHPVSLISSYGTLSSLCSYTTTRTWTSHCCDGAFLEGIALEKNSMTSIAMMQYAKPAVSFVVPLRYYLVIPLEDDIAQSK
ncbi:Cation-transporting P-type ATPase, C-terminal [Dillenia turbinata]|uniref:Calcium-transporting ATPase n=1 Tax=Dillenia turbinata TaxID=194707 RepID=A0AAN8ZH60_9MAGN